MSRYRPLFVWTAKILLLVLVLWGVRHSLLSGIEQLDRHEWRFSPGWLALAGLIYLLGLWPSNLFWGQVLHALDSSPPRWTQARAYYISHLGKYVPGKAMVVVLRTVLLRSAGVDAVVAAVSAIYETLTMMAVGGLLAVAALLLWAPDRWRLILLAAGVAGAMVVPTWPGVFQRLVAWAGIGQTDRPTGERLVSFDYRQFIGGWLRIAAGWCLMAISLWATLRSLDAAGVSLVEQMPLFVASVTLAVVAGFVSLIPGGSIVREAVLMQLLVPQYGEAVALVAALLLRMVWLVSELAISSILYLSGDVGPRNDRARSEPAA